MAGRGGGGTWRSVVIGAEAEFERARRPFAGQRPLVDIRDGAVPVLSRPSDSSTHVEKGPVAHTLHTVVYESRSGRLVRINLPFRVVRLMHPNGFTYLGELTFLEDTEFDSDRVLLTLDDLERHAPTLVVDHRHLDSGQFLAWVE
jgi:hypothetical protein